MIKKKEYPEYDSFDIGDKECYELYAKKLKEMLKEKKEFTYPLDTEDVYIADVGRTRTDTIDPCKFIDLALPKAHIRKCSLPYITDAYKYGVPKLSPVQLWVDHECNVILHSGRHRASVACDLGIKKIPILIKYPDYVYGGEDSITKMREVSKLLQNENNDWENLNKYKDEFIYPNECSIDNLKKEKQGVFRIGDYNPEKAKKRNKELRDKYSITDTVKKHREDRTFKE